MMKGKDKDGNWGDTFDWTNDNAIFRAYFFGDGVDPKWVNMVKVADGIYRVKKPSEGYNKLIFVRCDPNSEDTGWGSRWNQTDDLEIVSYNYFTCTDKGEYVWSTYNP